MASSFNVRINKENTGHTGNTVHRSSYPIDAANSNCYSYYLDYFLAEYQSQGKSNQISKGKQIK